ncbi:MAG: glycosyltransferase family 2 protein [Actinomycetota bacterium]|nr:glycosyltransferase family 2 protein [Actinomycetota bacterium]MCL6093615.1 glycosyltransferase family 2 protein [Actinomycetota bacterium]MDA8166910.1 glycosyltransferase family 2 protein [Actinomycetota bacterium]
MDQQVRPDIPVHNSDRMRPWVKVNIVIVNWNGWKDTIECLTTVFQNGYPNYQVIVVDNDSSDGSIEQIKMWAEGKIQVNSKFVECNTGSRPIPYIEYDGFTAERGGLLERENELYGRLDKCISHPLILIQTGENLGFAGGNNVGIRCVFARDENAYFWLLNNDTVIKSDALQCLVSVAEDDESVGIIGSKILFYHNPDVIQAAGGGVLFPLIGRFKYVGGRKRDGDYWNRQFPISYVMGASMLIKGNVLKDIGLLASQYFLGWEETDFCTKAVRNGWKLGYACQSRVWHKNSATVGVNSASSDYYGTRNSIWFLRKYHRYAVPSATLFGLITKPIVRLWRRQADRIPLLLKAYWDGLFSNEGKPKCR